MSETNPIADTANYQNIGSPNTQDIYIRVDSTLDNDCLGLGHHITLNVETVPIAHSVSVAEQCDDDGDDMYAFDTSTLQTNLLNGQTNLIVEYYDGLGGALPSPLPNPFLTSTQDITARVIDSSSQDSDGACFDETIISFVVQDAATANTVSDFIECDDDNDGLVAFDTSNLENEILSGQTGMLVKYFDQEGNALPSPLPNPFISGTQSITVRVENTLSMNCFDEIIVNFTISEQPIAMTILNDFICDDSSNDGEHIFTLANYNDQILGVQSNTTYEIFYYDNELDAQNNNDVLANLYTVSSSSQILYARIQNVNNPNCFDITSFELGVNYLPIAYQPEDFEVCDDDSNDGFETVDLTSQNASILNEQSDVENVISYHLSLEDAEEGVNPLSSNFTNTSNPQTIHARIENVNSSECYTTIYFNITVNEQPILLMNDLWPICEGSNVQIIADEGYDYYNWSSGQTTRVITVDEPGQYSITASNVYGDLICSVEKTITVAISNIATITDIETVDWSQSNNTISVFVEGNGEYEYSLDGNNYQDNSIFSDLTVDDYTVYVRDKNGCGIISEDVYLIYYPRYFTPNGDGNNEAWQIINSSKEVNNKVYIYDRYGKLITQLKPNDFGWDGTLNGNKLPTSDYWFVLERQNGKTYTGHFTLKR